MTATDRPTPTGDVSVEHVASAKIPTAHGLFTAHAYRAGNGGEEHLAYVMGDLGNPEPPLVRLHSECLTGDVLASERCDCGPQLQKSLELIANEKRGVVVYLRGHEGRGIGLGHKIRAYGLQDTEGLDTVDANIALGLPIDSRDYTVGALILRDLGLTAIRLLTNNPRKVDQLVGAGLDIVDKVPLEIDATPLNGRYLATKRDRLGHTLI